MTGPRTIRLVLDTTAITAWCRGSIAVGELIAEINDEYGAVVIPLPCLVEAAHKTAMLEQQRLDLLVGHEATVLLVDDAEEWKALAATRTVVGHADLASAALFAMLCDVSVMTRDARWYSELGGTLALEFDDE